MKVETRGEDVLLVAGDGGIGIWEAAFNPNDARSLGWQLVKAADEASAAGRLMEQVAEAKRRVEEKQKRHAEAYKMATPTPGAVVDAEYEAPRKDSTPFPKHNVAVLFAAGVLVDVRLVEGCPARLQQDGGYHVMGTFVYELDSTVPVYVGPGSGVVVLSYVLKERI